MSSEIIPFRPADPPPGDVLVSAIVRDYLACKVHELGAATYADTRKLCELFVAAFGDRVFDTLRPSQVKSWILGRAEWTKANTRWKKSNTLKAIFNWASEDRLIPFNPIKRLSFPKGERRRATAEQEFQRMLAASSPCFRLVLVFLRAAGCRPADVRGLLWEWVQCDDQGVPKLIVIPANAHKSGKRTGKPKLILLPDADDSGRPGVASRLLLWIRQQRVTLFDKPSGPIFLNSRGQPWSRSAFAQRLTRIRAETGLEVEATFHGLRHQYTTTGLAEGAGIKQMADILGHASTQTTAGYAHLEEEALEQLRKLAALGARRRHPKRKKQQGPGTGASAGPMLPFPD